MQPLPAPEAAAAAPGNPAAAAQQPRMISALAPAAGWRWSCSAAPRSCSRHQLQENHTPTLSIQCMARHTAQPASLARPRGQAHALLTASGQHLRRGRPPPACTTPQQTPGAYKRPAKVVKRHLRPQQHSAVTVQACHAPDALQHASCTYQSGIHLPCGDACGGSPPATPAAGRRSACAPPPDLPLLTAK